MRKRRITKLGRCPHCKKLVSRRGYHTAFGYKPQWVIYQGRYYHKHCWDEVKKSIVRRTKTKIGYETPPTPFGKGKIDIERD